MVVAAGTAERRAEKRLTDRGKGVVELVVAGEADIVRLVIPSPQMPKARGNNGGVGARLEEIAGDLLADEAVERHVVVDRTDHPVAVAPGIGLLVVAFVAVGLGIADDIEPVPRLSLAVGGHRQELLHEHLPGGVGGIAFERLHHLQWGRQADGVEPHPSHLLARRRGGIGMDVHRGHSGPQDGVDGSDFLIGSLSGRRHGGPDDWRVGPA